MNLNVVSYNLLNPYHAHKWKTPEGCTEENGELHNNWDRMPNPRRERIMRNLSESGFDVACLQEVNPHVHNELKEWGASRHIEALNLSLCRAGPQETDEQKLGVTILYNTDKLECVSHKVFSSLTSTEWPRGEIYGDFRLRDSHSIVRIFSTHLKGYDPSIYEPTSTQYNRKQQQKCEGLQEIQDVIDEALTNLSKQHKAVAVCGDFNCHRTAELYEPNSRHAYIIEKGFTTDGNEETSEARTGRKIDWIYVKSTVDQPEIALKPGVPGQQDLSASDHYLISTVITNV